MIVCNGVLANFAEQNVSVGSWDSYSDLLPKILNKDDYFPILDAENELVAIVPKNKADVLVEIINRFEPDDELEHVREKAWSVLQDLRDGKLTLSYQKGFVCGPHTWITSNGWKFEVFDDNGEWGYIQGFGTPEGAFYEYEFIGRVEHWQPSEEELKNLWKWGQWYIKS